MIYFLKKKSEAFKAFQDYETAVVKHWMVRAADPADSTPGNLPLFIAKLRTDGGGEYTSREFTQYLGQKGIEAQVTTPYTPQSNGVTERANRTIMQRVRSMISWAGLPDSFWAGAVATATYLKNCTPTRGLEDLKRDFHTPFEGWFGRVTDLGHVRVWECVAMVRVPAEKTKKLDGRSEKCIFVGYCLTEKQYKVYNPVTRRMFSTRDVVFREEEKWGKIDPPTTNTTGSIGGKGIEHDFFQFFLLARTIYTKARRCSGRGWVNGECCSTGITKTTEFR